MTENMNEKPSFWEDPPPEELDSEELDQATEVIDLQPKPDLSEFSLPTEEETDFPQLEMRQIAGLSAGSKMLLPEGTFNFREGNKDTAFSVTVNQNNRRVTVTPGTSEIWINDHLVTEPTPLSGGILDVGSARFTILPPRPEYGPYTNEIEPRERATLVVPEFHDADYRNPWTPGAAKDLEQTNLDTQSWEFIEQIRAERDEDARLQRLLHPDPEELAYRITQDGFGLFNRSVEHPFFARFSISYGPIPWIPKFSDPAGIPPRIHQNIDNICSLQSVPISANLTKGPLGIVGPRSAALSCARHMILSLTALNEPGSIELKFVTSDQTDESNWQWIDNLPSWVSSKENTFRIVIADGIQSYELAGLDHADAENKRIGLIVLANSIKELPPYCSTVLQVSRKGLSRATNQQGSTVQGTPIGVSESFAAHTAETLRNLRPTI